MNEISDSLLAADELAPVTVHNENGLFPFLIVADHGGNVIPRALSGLGVSEAERQRLSLPKTPSAGLAAVPESEHDPL